MAESSQMWKSFQKFSDVQISNPQNLKVVKGSKLHVPNGQIQNFKRSREKLKIFRIFRIFWKFSESEFFEFFWNIFIIFKLSNSQTSTPPLKWSLDQSQNPQNVRNVKMWKFEIFRISNYQIWKSLKCSNFHIHKGPNIQPHSSKCCHQNVSRPFKCQLIPINLAINIPN